MPLSLIPPVSLTLSSSDVARLEAALATLLSPLTFEGIDQWRSAARRAIEPLVGADKSTSVLPLPGEALIQCDAADEPAYQDYLAHYIRLDTGFHVKRRELGLEVSHGWMLYDPATVLRTELYADWACRYRMLQPMALAVELPASRYPAVLSFHREKAAAPNAYEREMGILHLLLPAFKAGVFACRRLVRNRASLTILIDRLPGGIAVFDVAGHLLHQNPAIGRLLASEPESARVHAELGRIAGLVAALAHRAQSKARASTPTEPAELEVRTARARYHIRGSHVGCELLPHPAAVIVCIENASPERLTSMEVASRHRLTAREIEVALLLAEGRSNAQVARMLGFTIHTARRHAEHILLKLELHSRAEVGPKLYGLSGSS